MSFDQTYAAKLRTAHDTVDLIRDGDTIVAPVGVGEAPGFLAALSDRRTEFTGVQVSQILPLYPAAYLDPTTVEHVAHNSYFLSGVTRPGAQAGWVDYRPAYFYETPKLFARGMWPHEVVTSMASPMDEEGYLYVSLGPDYTIGAAKTARDVILEVNPHVPQAYGDCKIHIDQVSAVYETDNPIKEVGLPTIGPIEQAIGNYVAELIPDGATLQIGFGAIPDAVVLQLLEKKDLGVHTEMIGDGILTLIEAGVVNNSRKNVDNGIMRATFALGTHKLYEWMHRNPMLRMDPVDVTNDPAIAGLHDNLISINATMQVDLIGQCGSETLGLLPFSGTGGQADFVRSANRSEGGKSFIVTPATAKGGTVSRIVLSLAPGTQVTTTKNDVDHVVTEFGVAQLRGRSAKERARALIAIAHPDFRAELTEQAERHHLL